MLRRIACAPLVAAVLVLCGCVAGQTLSYDYTPTAVDQTGSGAVSIVVADERPYVTSGEKSPAYVGHYRAGFGNPWDVTTKGDAPFADIMLRDLREELAAIGYSVGEGGKTIQVSIREWNMDTYLNAKFWYELIVRVIGPDTKTILTEQRVADTKRIDGSVWVGPKYAVEKQMPALYDEALKKIVRENAAVLEALNAQ